MRPSGARSSTPTGPDWPPPTAPAGPCASSMTYSPSTPTPHPAPKASSAVALRQCPPEQRRQLLVDHVAALASAVMGLTPAELDPSTGFFQLGMDSLMSVTLQRNLSASLGQPLSPAVIFDYPTVDSLAAHLATLLPNSPTLPTLPSELMSTPTPEPPKTNCCNNSAKGWADQHEHPPHEPSRTIIAEALHKIDDLTARLQAAEHAGTEPIAVVGMGCRFPGGVNNPEAVLGSAHSEGRSGIVGVPPQRWDAEAFYTDDHTVPGTICNREGGFLTGWQPDEFDAEFFAISPREAAAIDPQQRLLLEVAYEALGRRRHPDPGDQWHPNRGHCRPIRMRLPAHPGSPGSGRGPRRLPAQRKRRQLRRRAAGVSAGRARPVAGRSIRRVRRR